MKQKYAAHKLQASPTEIIANVNNEPIDVLVCRRIVDLANHYGIQFMPRVFEDIKNNRVDSVSSIEDMEMYEYTALVIHMNNLIQTYGLNTVKENYKLMYPNQRNVA